jgi:transposase-like protein
MYDVLTDRPTEASHHRCAQGTVSALSEPARLGPRDAPLGPRAPSEADYPLGEFSRDYPDDAACLERLWRERFAPDGHHAYCPRCERERKFHRTTTRASFTCDSCGLHVHPMRGTIFEKSRTSLRLWFYAMYMIASTRRGISTRQLQRELGVGYKTADRMRRRIENLMADLDPPGSPAMPRASASQGRRPAARAAD